MMVMMMVFEMATKMALQLDHLTVAMKDGLKLKWLESMMEHWNAVVMAHC